MTVQYQVDGDIFREITTNWLCAFVNEFLIKARRVESDQIGNTVEYFQLNDGRVFVRQASSFQPVTAPKNSTPRLRNMRPDMCEQSLTQPR